MDLFDYDKDVQASRQIVGDGRNQFQKDSAELLDFLDDSVPHQQQQQHHQKKLSDDFEHVVDPFDSQVAHKMSDDLDDFMGTTQQKFQNFSSDFERAGNDLISGFGKTVEDTMDFMNAERGFMNDPKPAGRLPEPSLLPAKQPSPVVPVRDNSDDDDDNFNVDSYNPSPVKKPFKTSDDHNEKFISSEDLLGGFDRSTPEKKLPATKHDDFMGISQETKIPERPSIPPPAIPTRIEDIKEPAPPMAPVPVLPPKIEKKKSAQPEPQKQQQRPQMIQAEEMFYKFGLDAWFKPDRLHPQVESLIYWRDVKKSGIVFAAGLITLLAISMFSAISVVAYLSLMLLTGTIVYRIYQNVIGAIQKTSNGHPFKEYLEWDLNLSQDKVQQITNVGVAHINAFVGELRRLFLVEDLVDSLKFGLILWILTYIGAWFNGMTLVILAYIALFSLPKVYEQNKQIIDQNLDIVRSKFLEITDKIKVAIPIGKKPTETDKDK